MLLDHLPLPRDVIEHIVSFADIDTRRTLGLRPCRIECNILEAMNAKLDQVYRLRQYTCGGRSFRAVCVSSETGFGFVLCKRSSDELWLIHFRGELDIVESPSNKYTLTLEGPKLHRATLTVITNYHDRPVQQVRRLGGILLTWATPPDVR
jgi:hypothetical protein